MIVAEPATPVGATGRVIGWVKHHVPTRESIEANRWLRPVAHRILVPALWRFTRRSVPRGVSLGLFTGMLFPIAHTGVAACLAFPFRANVPTAVVVTVLYNPLTIPPLWWLAYQIGHWILRLDRAVPGRPLATNVKANEGVLHWLVAQGGPATIVGLVILATLFASIGYFGTALVWRLKMARKWRRRHLKTAN